MLMAVMAETEVMPAAVVAAGQVAKAGRAVMEAMEIGVDVMQPEVTAGLAVPGATRATPETEVMEGTPGMVVLSI
jgi:hypothetical protein